MQAVLRQLATQYLYRTLIETISFESDVTVSLRLEHESIDGFSPILDDRTEISKFLVGSIRNSHTYIRYVVWLATGSIVAINLTISTE